MQKLVYFSISFLVIPFRSILNRYSNLRHYPSLITIVAGATSFISGSAAAFQFVEPQPVVTTPEIEKIEVPGVRSGDIVWGDFNRDKVLDLAVAGIDDQDQRSLSIYLAEITPSGRKTFSLYQNHEGIVGHPLPGSPSFQLPGFSDVDLLPVDFNNDGWLDLVAVGETDNGYGTLFFENVQIQPDGSAPLRVLENFLGDGPAYPGVRAGLSGGGFDMADFNRDGMLDVALTGITGPGELSSSIYYGSGLLDENRAHASDDLIPLALGDVAWMDYDLDGWMDLALCGTSFGPAVVGSTTLIYRNNQANGFDLMHTLPGVTMGDLAWGDIDQDGWPDLAVTGLSTQTNLGRTAWFSNQPDPGSPDSRTFQFHSLPDGMRRGQLALADLDLDGWLDLVAVGEPEGSADTQLRVYMNDAGSLQHDPDGEQWLLHEGGGATAALPIPDRASFALGIFPENTANSSAYGLDLVLTGGIDDPAVDMKTVHAASPVTDFVPSPERPDPQSLRARILRPNVIEFSWERSALDSEGVRTWDVEVGRSVDSEELISSLTHEFNQGFGTSEFRLSPVAGAQGLNTQLTLDNLDYRAGEVVYWRVEALDGAFRPSGFSPDPIYRHPFRVPYLVPDHESPSLGLAGGVEAGDFDKDGDLDLVVVGTNGMQLWENQISFDDNLNASSTWVERPAAWDENDQPIPFTIFSQGSVTWGDVNGDNYLDLLVAGTSPVVGTLNDLTLFINEERNGRREFIPHVLLDSDAEQGSARWIDFDLDGDLDIALTGGSRNSPSFKLLRNNFDPQNPVVLPAFQPVPGLDEILEVGANSSLAVEDFDRDGWPDLVVSGYNQSQDLYDTTLYRNAGPDPLNPGAWQWEAVMEANLEGVQSSSLAWGDWDEDGWPDLFLTGVRLASPNEYFAVLYLNRLVEGPDGGMKRGLIDANMIAEFDTASVTNHGYSSGDCLPVDLNHDGRLDLILTGSTSSGAKTTVWLQHFDSVLNQRSFVLLEEASSGDLTYGDFTIPGDLPPAANSSLATGDFNLDQRADIALVGSTRPIGIFLNNWNPSNPAENRHNLRPLSPETIGLNYVPGSGEATIQWPQAQDITNTYPDTPPASISYRTALRESETDSWWISPQGTDLLPHFGAVSGVSRFGSFGQPTAEDPEILTRTLRNFTPRVGQRFEVAVQSIDSGYAASSWTQSEVQIASFIRGQISDQNDPDAELVGWTVFWDLNGNGQLDGVEPSAITGAEGKYEISVTTPGVAPIRQILLPGWREVNGPANPVEVVVDAPSVINLPNFVNVFESGSVYGRLWEDSDGDGLVDTNEEDQTLSNWIVFADYNENASVDADEPSTASFQDGRYLLDGVGVGQHRVRVDPASIPNGWERTFPVNEVGPVLLIVNGETVIDADFGYRPVGGGVGNGQVEESILSIAGMQPSTDGSEVTLSFDILVPGNYILQRSIDLIQWDPIRTISEMDTNISWVEPKGTEKVFFRLELIGSTTTTLN